MKIGYVGLGKMGFNMVERLLEKGYQVAAFDLDRSAVHDIRHQFGGHEVFKKNEHGEKDG